MYQTDDTYTIKEIDGMRVAYKCLDGAKEPTDEELLAYVKSGRGRFPYATWNQIVIHFLGNSEDVDILYDYVNVPIERIRRITGYLVGTTDRWNNAKQAELRDRVKHGNLGRNRMEDYDGK